MGGEPDSGKSPLPAGFDEKEEEKEDMGLELQEQEDTITVPIGSF